MSTGTREDPILAYNFQVTLMESPSSLASKALTITFSSLVPPAAGFSECSGLEMSLDVQEFMEGGNNGTVLKFPTRLKPGNITLKKGLMRRGLTTPADLWSWFNDFSLGQGRRRDGVITVMDGTHTAHTVYSFRRGLPLKYSGPQLNAGQNTVAVESVEIAHEGLFLVSGGSALLNAAASAVGAIGSLV